MIVTKVYIFIVGIIVGLVFSSGSAAYWKHKYDALAALPDSDTPPDIPKIHVGDKLKSRKNHMVLNVVRVTSEGIYCTDRHDVGCMIGYYYLARYEHITKRDSDTEGGT